MALLEDTRRPANTFTQALLSLFKVAAPAPTTARAALRKDALRKISETRYTVFGSARLARFLGVRARILTALGEVDDDPARHRDHDLERFRRHIW